MDDTSTRSAARSGAPRPARTWAGRAAGLTVALALLVPAGSAAAGDPPKTPAQKAAEARAKQDQIRREKADVATRIDAMQATEEQMQAALDAIDAELGARQATYDDAKAAADSAREHARQLEEAIRADEASVSDMEQRLRTRAIEAYVSPDPEDDPTALFRSEHFDDAERRKVLADTVNGNARDILDELAATRARLEQERQAAEAALAEADAKEREAEAAKNEVQVLRDEQAKVKAAFDQKLYEEQAHNQALNSADAELTNLITQAENEQRQQEDAARQAAASRATAGNRPAASAGSQAAGAPGLPPVAGTVNRPASSSGLVWPISGTVSQEFGGANGHPGLDIFAPMGTPIYAAKSGTVIFAGWNNGGYGNLVVVEHGDGFSTAYAHQSEVLVSVGQTVSTGQLVGREGSTGYSTGPHLHFETRINGRPANPRQFLP
jgi:septal ring factor EnvC (AmiA/AmiB activator)